MATASSLKNQLSKKEVVGPAPIANSVKARVVYLMMCASIELQIRWYTELILVREKYFPYLL